MKLSVSFFVSYPNLAITQVFLTDRAVCATIDTTSSFTSRTSTNWHELHTEKTNKHSIVGKEALRNRCRAAVEIVERLSVEAAERRLAEMDRGFGMPAAETNGLVTLNSEKFAGPESSAAVFDMFHAVEEVAELDSIYKNQLLLEVRIEHFAKGDTVFQQGDVQGMVSRNLSFGAVFVLNCVDFLAIPN